MIETSLDPTSLSYGLIVTHLLNFVNVFVGVVSFVFVRQCYNSTSFGNTGYNLVDDAWVCKSKNYSAGILFSPKFCFSPLHPHTPSFSSLDVDLLLIEIDSKLDSLKDLLLTTQF